MSSFITAAELDIGLDDVGANDENDDDDILNPNNSARSDGGQSTAQLTKSELLNEDGMSEGDGDENDDEFDSKAATAVSDDRFRVSSGGSKASQTPTSASGTSCELLTGLVTLEVSELTYPDFLLVQRLRCRAHSLLFYAVAHCIYLVNTLNGVRLKAVDMLHPETKYTRKIVETVHPDPVRVAIIGLGRLGRSLVKSLLTFGFMDPKLIKVGTRHHEHDDLLKGKGVELFHDNKMAAAGAEVVFVCVPPHSHIEVLQELNASVQPSTLVVTFAPPFTVKKLQVYAPNLTNLIRPEYELFEATAEQQNEWNCTLGIPDILEHKTYIDVTCPLMPTGTPSRLATAAPIICSDRLLETFFYAIFNHCCMLGLSWEQTVDCLNIVVFGSRCDLEDHATEHFLKIHNVVLPRGASATTPRAIGAPTTPRSSVPASSTMTRTNTGKSLMTIENHMDSALKTRKPTPVSLVDIYTRKSTPLRSALLDDPDDAVRTKRQMAFKKAYWQQFRRYLEWRKWNHPPDVSYLL